jgi:hypothetical protein
MFILMAQKKTENGYSVTQYTNFPNVFYTFKILYNFTVKKVLSSLHKFT